MDIFSNRSINPHELCYCNQIRALFVTELLPGKSDTFISLTKDQLNPLPRECLITVENAGDYSVILEVDNVKIEEYGFRETTRAYKTIFREIISPLDIQDMHVMIPDTGQKYTLISLECRKHNYCKAELRVQF